MNEGQCFEQCIPKIAEIIIEARKMTAKEYEWKINRFYEKDISCYRGVSTST